MNLTFDEGKLFYDLYAALLAFVNWKLKVSSEQFLDSRELQEVAFQKGLIPYIPADRAKSDGQT